MKYDELVKALRICSSELNCDDCPLLYRDSCSSDDLMSDAAAAIEALEAAWIKSETDATNLTGRLAQAEADIDRLNGENEALRKNADEYLRGELEELKELLNDADVAADDNGRQVEEMQAEVKQLAKRNAELHAEVEKWVSAAEKAGQPHWVSVEQPPKFSGKVVVWREVLGDFYDREYIFDVAYYNGIAGGPVPKGTFFQPIPGKTEYIVLDDVTHWWWPEPPQKVQE